MKYLTSIVVLIASAALLLPEPTLRHAPAIVAASGQGQSRIIEIVTGKSGRLIEIVSTFKGEVVWDVDERLIEGEAYYVDTAKKALIMTAPAGVYLVMDISTEGTKPVFAKRKVVVEGVGPPPGPDVIPIPPTITLRTKLQAAFVADKGAEADRKALAAGLDEVGKLVPAMGKGADVKQAVDILSGPFFLAGKLPGTVAVINAYITEKATVYATPTLLTPTSRSQIASAIKDVVDALGGGPAPGPVVATGFRVIMVSESNSNMTREQLNILNSTKIRAYLAAKTAKENNQPGWRSWDKDTPVEKEKVTAFRDIWAKGRPLVTTLPAFIISTDAGLKVEPFPENEAAALAVLKQYGGE